MSANWFRIGDICEIVPSSSPLRDRPECYGMVVTISGFGPYERATNPDHEYQFVCADGVRGSCMGECLRRIDDDSPNAVTTWGECLWQPNKQKERA